MKNFKKQLLKIFQLSPFTFPFLPKFKVLLLLPFIFCLLPAFGQSPEKISYQAVIRDTSNSLVVNQQIGVKISILKSSTSGTLVYEEIFNPNPQTNENGLLALEIGTGDPLTGIFSDIDWSNDSYFLKTEIDPTGSTNYTIEATTQLLSVPYALHAKTADTLLNEIDPTWNGLSNETSSIGRTGNVGIGTISPSQKLEVLGNTTSNNYLYRTPKTRYLNIGEADFTIGMSANGDIVKSMGMGGAGIVNSTGINLINAPIHLPQGAIVTNIDVIYYDNSTTGNMTITFQSRNTYVINTISSGETTSASTTPQTISFAPNITIDNSTYSYAMRIYSNGWPTDGDSIMRIYNVKITYTISETD